MTVFLNLSRAFALAVALAGCSVMPQDGDDAPPVVTASELRPVTRIFSSDPAVTVEERVCPPGSALAAPYDVILGGYPPDRLGRVLNVRDSGRDTRLLVSFSDPSGIAEARIVFPPGVVRAPTEGVSEITVTHGRNSHRANQYLHRGDPGDPRSPHLVTLDFTPEGRARDIVFHTRDFAGNEMNNILLFYGERAVLCD